MRKQVLVILVLSLILTVTACGTSSGGGESEVVGNEKATFQATILEIHDGYYLVEPVAGSTELNSADQITVPMTKLLDEKIAKAEQERSRLTKAWGSEKQMAKASSAYEANIMMGTTPDSEV